MNHSFNDYLLDVSREDIEWLTEQILSLDANTISTEVIPLDQLDLSEILLNAETGIGGITDPIGQLQQWLSDVLSQIADYIVNAIRGIVEPILNAIQGILNNVSGMLQSLVDTVTNGFNQLASLFQQYIVTPLVDALNWLSEQFPKLASTIQDILSSISDFLASLPEMISNAISNIVSMLSEAIKPVVDAITGIASTIGDFLAKLPDMLSDAINNVIKWLSNALQGLVGSIQNVLATIGDWLSKLPGMITEAISDVVEWLSSAVKPVVDIMSNIISTIGDFLSKLPSMIVDAINNIVSWLSNAFKPLIDAITSAFNYVRDFISQLPNMISGFIDWIRNAFQGLVNALTNIGSTILNIIQQIPSMVINAINTIINTISNAFQGFISTIQNALSTIADWISNIPNMITSAIETIVSMISSAFQGVVDWFAKIQETVSNIITGIIDNLKQIPSIISEALDTIRDFIANLPSYAIKAIENVEQWIYEKLPDWVKKFLEEAPKSLAQLGVTIQGFVNAILKFPEWFPVWFEEKIAKPIVEGLSKALETYLGPVKWFLDTLQEGIKRWQELFKDPVGFYKKYLVEPTIKWIKDIVSEILGILDKLEDYAYEIAKKLVKKGEGIIVEPLSRLFESMITSVIENYKKLMKGELKLHEFITSYLKSIIPVTMEIAGILEGLRFIGKEINAFIGKIQQLPSMLLAFAGVAEGEAFETLADIMEKGAWSIAYNVPFSVAFWMAQPLQTPIEYAFRYQLREVLPFALPTTTQIRDIIRRLFAKASLEVTFGKEFIQHYRKLLEFHALRGYSDYVLEFLFDPGVKYVTKVIDRFGGEREIPLSLLWDLPSRSDLVRMLQRDVFQSPMEWANFIIVHGLNEDLGKMYYMMSFEYPSFEKLWEFFVRGISGMLWYEPPDFIKEWFKQDAMWLGAGIPVEPKKLNYDYKALFKAIPFYLKWIQKSNFSWFRKGAKLQYGNITIDIDFDWTADSWMLWDISADLPGKIDARWMAKWALFDHISSKAGVEAIAKGVAPKPYPETPFVDLVTKVVEDTITSDIYMDLRPFTRLLVANGIHPAWVPMTAVAEAINALADERTLLRTGFINLFKEGFWNYTTIDKLLDGFFVASFAVEYFDPTKKQWKAGAINAPVKFLPAERRLLELRALMDRALDILRDLVKELTRSYAEHVIITKDEYMSELLDGINKTNEWFTPLIKEMTGKELKLIADKDYWEAYAKVLDIYRELYTVRRIRYWVGRILTWSFYRLAYEYVTVEDVKRLLGIIKDVARLTTNETIALEHIMNELVGIAKREYIPTPSQLATIAEIVPEVTKYAKEVLEKRNVPKEWWDIWLKYIDVKPIKDDVSRLLTAYRRAKVYNVPLGDLEKQIIELAKKVGYTDRELSILALRIQLEELINEVREMRKAYLPTPMMLATLSEYITIPLEFVKEVLEKRRVPKAWINLWLRYIQIRPLGDEARMLATAFYKAKRYGVPLDGLEKQVLEILRELGFTEQELRLRDLRATIEALIDQWKETQREYIPTPSMLATISEIVPEARQLLPKVLERRHVPKEWWDIWIKYVAYKPLIDEVKRYVKIVTDLFEYFAIKEDELRKALERVMIFGYEKQEIDMIVFNTKLEASLRAYRELLGTPRQLVTMAEYSPRARNIVLAQVQKMIDLLPTDPQTKEFIKAMWEEYIRIRPVYDEVRRYVTELINGYASGTITRQELEQELNALKEWGLDDYEIQFYLWLAERRKVRYAKIYGQGYQQGYGYRPY